MPRLCRGEIPTKPVRESARIRQSALIQRGVRTSPSLVLGCLILGCSISPPGVQPDQTTNPSSRPDSGLGGRSGQEPDETGGQQTTEGPQSPDSGVPNDAPMTECEPAALEPCWEAEDGSALAELPSNPPLGNCRLGVRTCGSDGRFGMCIGAVGPTAQDTCEGAGSDDNCNGIPNENCSCVAGEKRPCGSDVGNCQLGEQTCGDEGWGQCEGAVPAAAVDGCDVEGNDANCNGVSNEGCVCIGSESEPCGECGTRTCRPESGQWRACEGGEVTETCGQDNNGQVVWQGAAVGSCREGQRSCLSDGTFSACTGAVGPQSADDCGIPGNDADCDGDPNSGCPCVSGESRACGSDVGACSKGTQACNAGAWGPCEGEVGPQVQDSCAVLGDDSNCNGTPNEGCPCIGNETESCGDCGTRACTPEARRWGACVGAELTEACGEDPTGKFVWQGPNKGSCREGQRSCQSDGTFSACAGAVGPKSTDDCNVPGNDANCDGEPNSDCTCVTGDKRACGSDVGACSKGTQTCSAGAWGSCEGEVGPQVQDSCAVLGDDSNCNGIPNEGCPCIGNETGDCGDCGTHTCSPSQRSWGSCQRKQVIQECTPGSSTQLRTCSSTGTWNTTSCSNGCYSGQCGECQAGDTRCTGTNGNIPQRCVDGFWVSDNPCGGATPTCQASTATCVCASNATRCANATTPEMCVSGTWRPQATCGEPTPTCREGACVCSESALRCTPAGSAAARQQCVNGSWQATAECTTPNPICTGNGDCGCTPSDTYCQAPNTVARCDNSNQWVLTKCDGGLNACDGAGQCRRSATVPGYVGCGGTLVCDSDQQCCFDAVSGVGVCQPDTPNGTTCAQSENSFEFNCDGPNDCSGGEVCCDNAYRRRLSFCTTDCSGTGTSVVCDPEQGLPSNPACPAGTTCQATTGSAPVMWRCK